MFPVPILIGHGTKGHTMNSGILLSARMIGVDLVAIVILAYLIHFRRHNRRDVLVALVGINVVVLGVASVLTSAKLGDGVGFGLFGVLSIIRIRAYQIEQNEIPYYFSALAIGLISGLNSELTLKEVLIIVLILLALMISDHPRLFPQHREHQIILDRAIYDEVTLQSHLASMMNAEIRSLRIASVNIVNETTVVSVSYKVPKKH